MNQDPEGEAATPPPSPVDYTAPASIPVSKPWPVLLAQAMRTGIFVHAQVALVGAVECRSPDPVTVLRVGGRWQVTHRQLKLAQSQLSTEERSDIKRYLRRDDVLELQRDQDGRMYYKSSPPPITDEEMHAFFSLWEQLHRYTELHTTT